MAVVYLFDFVFLSASPPVSFLLGFLVWLGGAAPGRERVLEAEFIEVGFKGNRSLVGFVGHRNHCR
jgi:hypothetical protein